MMKVFGTLLSLPLLFLGALFVVSAFHPEAVAQGKTLPRILVGAILVGGAGLLLFLAWRPRALQAGAGSGPGGQGIPGQLSLKPVVCPHCGGQVDPGSASMGAEGTLSVTCGYCKGAFLVQEEPKW